MASVVRTLQTLLTFDQRGLREAEQGFNRLKGKAGEVASSFDDIKNKALGIAAALATIVTPLALVARAGDAQNAALGQLGAALEGVNTTAAEAYEKLYAISRVTGVGMADSAKSFSMMMGATKDLGATADEVATIVKGMQQVGAISGTSTSDIAETMRQMGQGLGANSLQGEELGSLLENMAPLARALAKELGVPVGQLKKMGEDGELTSKKVFPALVKATASFDAQFNKLPVTMSRGFDILRVTLTRLGADLDKSLDLSPSIARQLTILSDWVESLRSYTPTITRMVYEFGGLEAILRILGIAAGVAAGAFAVFNAAMLVTIARLALIPVGILGIALALDDLYTWVTGGRSTLGRMFGPFETMLDGIKTKIAELVPGLAALTAGGGAGGMAQVTSDIQRDLGVMEGAFRKAGDYVRAEWWPGISAALMGVGTASAQHLAGAGVQAFDLRTAMAAAATSIQENWDGIVAFFGRVSAGITTHMVGAGQQAAWVEARFGDAAAYIKANWETILAFFGNLVRDLATYLTNMNDAGIRLRDLFSAVPGAIMGAWGGVRGFFESLTSGVANAFTSAWETISGIVKSITDAGAAISNGASKLLPAPLPDGPALNGVRLPNFNPGVGPASFIPDVSGRMGARSASNTNISSPVTNAITVNATGISGAEVAAAAQNGVGRAMDRSAPRGEALARAFGVASPRTEAAAA